MTDVVFAETIGVVEQRPLTAYTIDALQVNLGYRCNMSCAHCHVSAGPHRSEAMSRDTIEAVLHALRENLIGTLDITGGAPEMNPHFRLLVSEARRMKKRVLVRTNLSVMFEQDMEDLPEFYRDHGVELIASMPCYCEENVDAMRGKGAYEKSIIALRRLNHLGFGQAGGPLVLNLVYNPAGPFLAPVQCALEADYRRELKNRHDIVFTRLYAFTNMPLGRFLAALKKRGELEKYLDVLPSAFNPATLKSVMCRSLVNVGWDGRLYDCDFNQVLGMPVMPKRSRHITDFDYDALRRRTIAVADHCFACTAGQGSSCSGAAT